MKTNFLYITRKSFNWLTQLLNIENSVIDKDYTKTKAIIDKIKRYVYKEKGLVKYEKNSPPEMERLLYRSRAQYFAQKETYDSKALNFITNSLCFIIIPFFVVFANIRGLFLVKKKNSPANVILYYYDCKHFKSVIKNLFKNETTLLIKKPPIKLDCKDLIFILKCIKISPSILLSPRFVFSLIKWVSYYSGIIYAYNPKKICNFFEGSFASSIITFYVRCANIIHLNYMHGERTFSPLCSFCEFDFFYVYGKYWADLFKKLNCKAKFLINGNPYHKELFGLRKFLSQKPEKLLILHNISFSPNSEEYHLLLKILKFLPREWKIYLRFHPLEKDYDLNFSNFLKKDCLKIGFELNINNSLQPLDKNLLNSKVIIGVSTAALFEGFIAGCKVIYLKKSEELEDRYQDSQNVLFLENFTSEQEIKKFLTTPVIINKYENNLLNNLTKVLNNLDCPKKFKQK